MMLKRKLGLFSVLAIVMGDIIGSGIFFTPGELAAVASAEWQVYFFWALCGLIAWCGAITLAEISVLIPKAGVSYHALTEAYGPLAGFVQAWMMVLVSGPGAIAGVAILFGELANQVFGAGAEGLQLAWAVGAIVFFALINLSGVEWGGRTQVTLTTIKILGLVLLVAGGLFLAAPATVAPDTVPDADTELDLFGFVRFVGLGVAIVVFTYDGWIDASNVAGEVNAPGKIFPRALGMGVILVTLIYLLVNFAYLRVVPLEAMRANPTMVAPTVANAAFGDIGGTLLNVLMWISIFGAAGGLVMTLPRLFYAAASDYVERARGTILHTPLRALSWLDTSRGVPSGAILFAAGVSIAALLFFGTFSRIVTFFFVPFQFMNILLVASIYRLRPRLSDESSYRSPGYPVVPAVFILVMSLFLVPAILFNPLDCLIGIAMTLTGVPVYLYLARNRGTAS